jgi:DNA-binding LacI/PurR family transcriptional regulator
MEPSKFKYGLGKRSEDVLFELRRRLDAGVYPVGSLLPTERALYAELGVGLSTLRRAVARLSAEGRLKPHRGIGTTVLPKITPFIESRCLATMFPLKREYFKVLQDYALSKQALLVPFDRHDWNPAPEKAFLECVRQARHRGVLACCTPIMPQNDGLLAAMAAEGMRIIHLEPYQHADIEASYIMPDYHRAGYAAATRLLMAGYRRLKYLKMSYDWPAAAQARDGFFAGLQDQLGVTDAESTYLSMPTKLGTHPDEKALFVSKLKNLEPGTGIFCHDYLAASRLLECLKEAGLSVPGQVGVICVEYFDEDISGLPLDTVTFDRAGALQRALDWVFAPEAQPIHELLPPQLIARGSVMTVLGTQS